MLLWAGIIIGTSAVMVLVVAVSLGRSASRGDRMLRRMAARQRAIPSSEPSEREPAGGPRGG